MIYTIRDKKITARVSDIGAELISVRGADGFEYIWSGKEGYWSSHAPLLFPICGRLLDSKYISGGKEYGMSIHGFAKDSRFDMVSISESRLKLKLSSSEQTRAEYPFDFDLTAEFSISDGELDVKFTVENVGSEVMPYMLGWHPGFSLEADVESYTLELYKDSLTIHSLRSPGFVTGEKESYPLCDKKYKVCAEEIERIGTLIFTGTAFRTRLSSAKAKHALELSWSENLPYLCIWRASGEEAAFICLEPWSDVPSSDGVTPECFDTRPMSHLDAGAKEEFCYKISFE